MNKKAQDIDFGKLITAIFALLIFIPLLGIMSSIISQQFQQKCPSCDCSQYQNNLTTCNQVVENLTKQINDTPIRYVQNVTYVEIPVEKPIYKERIIPGIVISISFILSLVISISLFKIKLPKKIEERLDEIEDIIFWIKWASAVVSLLIFIKLVYILFSLL